MNTIKVEKKNLISILQKNRTQHEKDFIQAVKDFRLKVKTDLNKALNKVPSQTSKVSLDKNNPEESVQIYLTAPVNYLADYDRTIEMLKMDLANEVELTAHDFQCYVKDEWVWKSTFSATNNMYMEAKGPIGGAAPVKKSSIKK